MDLIWSEAGGSLSKSIVSGFDVREVIIPVVLFLATLHRKPLCYRMIDILSAAIFFGILRAGGQFTDAHQTIDYLRKVGGELFSAIG